MLSLRMGIGIFLCAGAGMLLELAASENKGEKQITEFTVFSLDIAFN